MARMIPDVGPRKYDPKSKEDRLYYALRALPDSYTVVHSMTFATVKNGEFRQSEGDFVVFHRQLGILCIEAKAGRVSYRDGSWFYSNGARMKKGGPFQQAFGITYDLIDLMKDKGLEPLLEKCKIAPAVWFMDLTRSAFDGVDLPEGCIDSMLDSSDLLNPEPTIRRILSFRYGNKSSTNLSEGEEKLITERVLCPQFNIVQTGEANSNLARQEFAVLLDEQKRVLNYMEDQRSVVISGSAGTGKTLIALEKVRRLAERGERVLFLCYNKLLKDYLRERCKNYGSVKVLNIDGLALILCGSTDYDRLQNTLESMGRQGTFPYDHVVVDEGQDFGREELLESFILDTLKELVTKSERGSFYLFYDKNQLVQGEDIPDFIADADCKMTLYINCRNTSNIAKTAAGSLGEAGHQVAKTLSVAGVPTIILFSKDRNRQYSFVKDSLEQMRKNGAKTLAVLTCSTEEKSALRDVCYKQGDQLYLQGTKTKVPFYSCRRFKGLEADGIVLVDVTKEVWLSENYHAAAPGLLFYTGASRARLDLKIVCDMDDEDALAVLRKLGIPKAQKPKQRLLSVLKAFSA